jgi:hypothetical protein
MRPLNSSELHPYIQIYLESQVKSACTHELRLGLNKSAAVRQGVTSNFPTNELVFTSGGLQNQMSRALGPYVYNMNTPRRFYHPIPAHLFPMLSYFTYLFVASVALWGALPVAAVTGCSCLGQTYSSSSTIGSYPPNTDFVSADRYFKFHAHSHRMCFTVTRPLSVKGQLQRTTMDSKGFSAFPRRDPELINQLPD